MITEICKQNKGKELMMPKVYITVFPGQVGNRKAVSYHHNTYHHNQYIDHIFCSVAKSCPALCDPGTAACQASLSFTISLSLLKLMSFELVMPSNHLILCCPLLLLPSIFSSIRVFSNELALRIRWPKNWSFSFSNGFPMNIQG